MLIQESGGAATSFHNSMPGGGYGVASMPLVAPADPATALHNICAHLTVRQRDVLAVMMEGKSNKAICRILNLAEPTVKNHVTAILKALRVTNRTEAVIKVARASVPSTPYSYTISGYSTFLYR